MKLAREDSRVGTRGEVHNTQNKYKKLSFKSYEIIFISEPMKEGNVLFHLFTVIWRQTYG